MRDLHPSAFVCVEFVAPPICEPSDCSYLPADCMQNGRSALAMCKLGVYHWCIVPGSGDYSGMKPKSIQKNIPETFLCAFNATSAIFECYFSHFRTQIGGVFDSETRSTLKYVAYRPGFAADLPPGMSHSLGACPQPLCNTSSAHHHTHCGLSATLLPTFRNLQALLKK